MKRTAAPESERGGSTLGAFGASWRALDAQSIWYRQFTTATQMRSNSSAAQWGQDRATAFCAPTGIRHGHECKNVTLAPLLPSLWRWCWQPHMLTTARQRFDHTASAG